MVGDSRGSILIDLDNTLPEDIRNKLLLKLSEKDVAAGAVASVVVDNFDKLPENVRNLLFTLSEKDVAVFGIAMAVIANFDKLPENVQNLLFKLSERGEAARNVAYAISIDLDNTLPEDIRNKLLLKLSEKDEAAWSVATTVAGHFDTLPEDVQNLLDGLQKPLQQTIKVLSRGKSGVRLTALFLISNALPKLNRDFVSKILNELSECEDETVRIKASKMLEEIFDDSEDKKKY